MYGVPPLEIVFPYIKTGVKILNPYEKRLYFLKKKKASFYSNEMSKFTDCKRCLNRVIFFHSVLLAKRKPICFPLLTFSGKSSNVVLQGQQFN